MPGRQLLHPMSGRSPDTSLSRPAMVIDAVGIGAAKHRQHSAAYHIGSIVLHCSIRRVAIWTTRRGSASIAGGKSTPGNTMNTVDVYRGWCKKCGICIAFCPHHVLSTDEEGFPVVTNAEACTGCRWCELRCPDFAIVVHTNEHTDERNDAAAG